MNIIKCANGHFYDSDKYSECPHCSGQEESTQKTQSVALEAQKAGSYAEEYIRQNMASAPASQTADSKAGQENAGSNRTESVGIPTGASGEEQEVLRCTAGWLVCISGADYGKSFPVYAGFNRIGRDGANDIVLTDKHVSREIHCSVIYEERKNIFYIFPQADTLSYIGEELVDRAVEMENGQIVTLGETQLELVAYCIGEKRWPKRNL